MNKLTNDIALFSTPGAILLNIDGWLGSMQLVNLVLAIIVSAISIISLVFVIRKNYLISRCKKLELIQAEKELFKN